MTSHLAHRVALELLKTIPSSMRIIGSIDSTRRISRIRVSPALEENLKTVNAINDRRPQAHDQRG